MDVDLMFLMDQADKVHEEIWVLAARALVTAKATPAGTAERRAALVEYRRLDALLTDCDESCELLASQWPVSEAA